MNFHYELDNFFKSSFQAPDTPVYHYTQQECLALIKESKFLKINPHTFLNKKDPDNKELERGVELVINCLQESNLKHIISTFEQYVGIKKKEEKNKEKKEIVYYTTSFCKNSKSKRALEKYGPVRLEFKPVFLQKFADSNKCLFGCIEYDTTRQEKIIKDMFNLYQDITKPTQNDLEELLIYISAAIPLFKNNNHMEYEECRIILFREGKNDEFYKLSFDESNVKIIE